MKIKLPYGKSFIEAEVEDSRVEAELESGMSSYAAPLTQKDEVRRALENPIASRKLRELARDAKNILVITSDHTRPVQSGITLPILLGEIRAENPNANVKILIATGLHCAMANDEMLAKFGGALVEREEFINHAAMTMKTWFSRKFCRQAAICGSIPS
jgi:nickel-dependent lactate racemase